MRLAVMAAWAAILLVGCAGDGSSPRGLDEGELADAQRFDGFPIYWLGREFEGRDLVGADDPATSEEPVGGFEYGPCSERDPGSGGDCSLTVETVPVSERHARVLRRRADGRIGGLPASVKRGRGYALILLYPPQVEVTVEGDDPEQVQRAAAAITRANP